MASIKTISNFLNQAIIILLLILFSSGCAPITVALRNEYKVGASVELNQRTSAKVGDVLFNQFEYISNNGARLINGISKRYGMTNFEVPTGTYLYGYIINNSIVTYCTANKTAIDVLGWPRAQSCFTDKDGDGKFENIHYGAAMAKLGDISIEPLQYKEEEVFADQAGFKYELVYEGINNNVISVSYREYTQNIARPAFQQNLTYTLEAHRDTEIAFRSVHILVHNANNREIIYTVLTSFRK